MACDSQESSSLQDIQLKLCVKVIVFWHVASCSLVKAYRHFKSAYCLHYQGGRSRSETSVKFYQTTLSYIPDNLSTYSPPWDPKISLNVLSILWKSYCRQRTVSRELWYRPQKYITFSPHLDKYVNHGGLISNSTSSLSLLLITLNWCYVFKINYCSL